MKNGNGMGDNFHFAASRSLTDEGMWQFLFLAKEWSFDKHIFAVIVKYNKWKSPRKN